MLVIRAIVALVAFLGSDAAPGASTTVDFSGIDTALLNTPGGQAFGWELDGVTGIVAVTADWTNLPDQGGPIRAATSSPASLASPFVGVLAFEFDRPVQIDVTATFAGLLQDTIDGGRFETVELTAPLGVTFAASPGTDATYSGVGTNQVLAEDPLADPGTSIWGFEGHGFGSVYSLVYTSTRAGFSETFDVAITSVVPEPGTAGVLGVGGLVAWGRRQWRAAPID